MDCKDGLLVGYNMEGFLFVITTIIPRDHLEKLDQDLNNSIERISRILTEEKFQTFKWYYGGDPLILGVIENLESPSTRQNSHKFQQSGGKNQPQSLSRIFKNNDRDIWITIQKEKTQGGEKGLQGQGAIGKQNKVQMEPIFGKK